MDSMDVLVPGRLVDALHDRDTFTEAPNVTVSAAGNRVRLTGPRAELTYLGDYVWELAGLVRDKVLTGEELGGYSVKKLYEIADRFPKAEAPAPVADAEAEPVQDEDADEVQDTAPAADVADAAKVADKLTTAQRAALLTLDENGHLGNRTAEGKRVQVGTFVALMDRGLCGKLEYDPYWDNPLRGEGYHEATPLGRAVVDVLRAEAEGFRAVPGGFLSLNTDPDTLRGIPGLYEAPAEPVQDEDEDEYHVPTVADVLRDRAERASGKGVDPSAVAAALSPAQRNALLSVAVDAVPNNGTVQTATSRALVAQGLTTEYGPFDPAVAWAEYADELPKGRAHWLTPLGAAVRDALRAEPVQDEDEDEDESAFTDEAREMADALEKKMFPRHALLASGGNAVSPGWGDVIGELGRMGLVVPSGDDPSPLTLLGGATYEVLRFRYPDVPVPEDVPASVPPVPERAAVERNEAATSVTVAAVEAAWTEIQAQHPEVPDVVVIPGGGTEVKRGKPQTKWGHFRPQQWDTHGGERHELFVSGECLSRGARHTLETLLHEAAHAVNWERNVKDTSRRDAYHNKRFVKTAAELGLVWPEGAKPHETVGFSEVRLTDEAAANYADALDRLDRDRRVWREYVAPEAVAAGDEGNEAGDDAEGGDEAEAKPKRSTNTKPKAACACGPEHAIWASRRVLERGTVRCGECDEAYALVDPQ